MRPRRAPSIQTAIGLTLLSGLAIVLGMVIIAHELTRNAAERSASRRCARLMAEAIAPNFTRCAVDAPRDLQAVCSRFLDHPSFLAIDVWGEGGVVIAQASLAPAFTYLLKPPPKKSSQIVVDDLSGAECRAVGRGPLHVIYAKLAGYGANNETMTVGVILDTGTLGLTDSENLFMFHGPIGLVGVVCLWIILMWLRWRIVQPMMNLAKASRKGSQPAADEIEDSEDEDFHEDEVGAIARSIASLHGDLRRQRQKAHLNKHRADSKLVEETRRIAAELREMEKEAITDSLTGLFNRRVLTNRYHKAFLAQRESGEDLAVIMFDLDHFKKTNDILGHVAGDEILRFVGELLKQCSRPEDLAARYGGDEFALVMPGTSARQAQLMAARIIRLFAQRAKIIAPIDPVPSLTAGIASMKHNQPASPAELLHLADQALYSGKQRGRKTACLAAGIGAGDPNAKYTKPSSTSTPQH